MAVIRQILQRRKAADSIWRLTKTMQIVSTAAFKSYYRKWVASHDYYDAMAQAGYLLATSQVPIDHPLLKDNHGSRVAILAIGSRLGLCGGYNNEVMRLLETHMALAKEAGHTLDVYTTEGKFGNLLRPRGIEPVKVYADIDEVPTDVQIRHVVDDFVGQYLAGEINHFGIVYMGFYSAGSQQAQTTTILPLTELLDHLITRREVLWPWDLAFEDFVMSPSADETVEALARMIVHASIKSCFMDAVLSEHVARMIAMRNATKNADDMIHNLTADYNRARQSQITGELLDIIGGMGTFQ